MSQELSPAPKVFDQSANPFAGGKRKRQSVIRGTRNAALTRAGQSANPALALRKMSFLEEK